MTPLRVGLTGGLASGKSTVAGLLRQRGWLVVDADRLVAELYLPGGDGAAVVRREFGASHLAPDGRVDHRRLAETVFGDEAARKRLEELIHPLVRDRFRSLAAQPGPPGKAPASKAPPSRAHAIAVLEATLLVEAGYAPDFDLVVTVEAPIEDRLRRAVERGLTESEARARLVAQGDGETRLEAADIRLDNDGTLGQLEEKVAELAHDLERRSDRESP